MDNIIYKTNIQGARLSDNTTGHFQECGWLIIEMIGNVTLKRGDYVYYGGAELPDSDDIYEIIEAYAGIYKVNRIKEQI